MKKIISVMKNDYAFRTFIFSFVSSLITTLFAGYNIFLWFVYNAGWHLSIAVYYFLLVSIRIYTIFSEKKCHDSNMPDEQTERIRKRKFLIQNFFLFGIDLILIAPISLMVVQKREIHYSLISAIVVAVYTIYKVMIATINYIKSWKRQNLSVLMLKTINFVDALVSVLSLQYILVMMFGGGVKGDRLTLCATTSFVILALLLVISVCLTIKAIK